MLSVLRLGHRLKRDERVSTHVGLVARAFGAGEIIYSGDKDDNLINSIKKVTKKWGGPFIVRHEKNWKGVIKRYKKNKFSVVHLTMYGLPVEKRTRALRKIKNLLILAGSEKVPGDVYAAADYNIAVTNQPHSEVAALAVFLHEYYKGKEFDKNFRKAKVKIIPQKRGKKVIEN